MKQKTYQIEMIDPDSILNGTKVVIQGRTEEIRARRFQSVASNPLVKRLVPVRP